MASHVADFETSQSHSAPSHPQPGPQPQSQPQQHPYPSHMMHVMSGQPHYAAHPYPAQNQGNQYVKTEPMDSRYVLNGPPPITSYAMPPLPGPQLNGARPAIGQPTTHTFSAGPTANGRPAGNARQFAGATPSVAVANANVKPQPPPQRIPQVDGAFSSGSESSSPPPSTSQAPPLSSQASMQSISASAEEEAINSDLDDSSTEGEDEAEESAAGETDIVFCTYDKVCFPCLEYLVTSVHDAVQVARVKNKWKCILKDGMIHINGRDYLFAKCTGYGSHLALPYSTLSC
jgi:transcription initiation factor TFIIA large subunit